MTDENQTQLDKFKQAAREHGADESEEHWDDRLKKLAKVRGVTDRPKRNP